MPRKQNGFGSASSFAFKGSGRVDKGKPLGAFGQYPSDRQYGSSVVRTIIENWNLNSNWSKWRRGYELYNIAAYSEFTVLNEDYDPGSPESETNQKYRPALLKSVLYQGTEYEIDTFFTAIEMPTLKSDVATHYVVKRFVEEDSELGRITGRRLDNIEEQQEYREVWFKGIPDTRRSQLLLQMYNERLTDGETEASLKTVLTKSSKLGLDIPAVYVGQTPSDYGIEQTDLEKNVVTVRIPLDKITITKNKGETKIVNQGLSTFTVPENKIDKLETADDYNQLIGKVVYLQSFYSEHPIDELDVAEWRDYNDFFTLTVKETRDVSEVIIYDPGVSVLPPSMYDLKSLPSVLSSTEGQYTLTGSYAFLKSHYQRYFKRNYLTDQVVKDEVSSIAYSVFPFQILGAEIEGDDLVLKSAPFSSQVKLFAQVKDGHLVFADESFVRYVEPANPDFEKAIDTNVDPWQDEVFSSGDELRPAEVYCCDCPSYSKALIAMPESKQSHEERVANRQNRYPLPTVMSPSTFEGSGINRAAGVVSSWQTPKDKLIFRMCKHTVTAMFVDKVQLIEPSQYPTQEEREIFEAKLQADLEKLPDAWILSAERGGISLTEIVFALSQGLNLDDVETGYVVLNTT